MTDEVGSDRSSEDGIVLALVGDVFLDRPNPREAFDHVRHLLRAADAAIANCEGVYSDEATYPPSAIHQMVVGPEMADGLVGSGLTAMSVANNHSVDGGHVALMGTIARLRDAGIAAAGAGTDIAEARAPAIFVAGDRRIGLLSYTSVMPMGYEARWETPGVAPLRVSTVYEAPIPNMWLPGYPPRIRMIHWDEDLAAMRADIAAVREQVDHLVVTVHQGNSQKGDVGIDAYERVAAHAAIDAGATVFAALGHHHSLRGMEMYRGRPVFYGAGNFAFDFRDVEAHVPPAMREEFKSRFGEDGNSFGPRADYPTYPFPPHYRFTAINLVAIAADGAMRAGLIPAEIQPDGRPKPHPIASEGGRRVRDHLDRCMAAIGPDWVLQPAEDFPGGREVLEIVAAPAGQAQQENLK